MDGIKAIDAELNEQFFSKVVIEDLESALKRALKNWKRYIFFIHSLEKLSISGLKITSETWRSIRKDFMQRKTSFTHSIVVKLADLESSKKLISSLNFFCLYSFRLIESYLFKELSTIFVKAILIQILIIVRRS